MSSGVVLLSMLGAVVVKVLLNECCCAAKDILLLKDSGVGSGKGRVKDGGLLRKRESSILYVGEAAVADLCAKQRSSILEDG